MVLNGTEQKMELYYMSDEGLQTLLDDAFRRKEEAQEDIETLRAAQQRRRVEQIAEMRKKTGWVEL